MPLTKATTNVVNLDKDTLINGVRVGLGAGNIGTNTCVGSLNMTNNTTGLRNTAVGHACFEFNTIGSYNTAVGAVALRSNTIGDGNSSIGHAALAANTDGFSNTAVGTSSLGSNTSGYNNTAVGVSASNQNITGAGNTAVGRDALYNNNSNYITGVGVNALFENTTGNGNVGIGFNAIYTNQTGSFNTGLGNWALANATTGRNTSIGHEALRYTTIGYDNTAVGTSASIQNISGHSNTACGISALNNNTTANLNTAIGADCLSSAVNFNNCSGIGYAAQVTGGNQVQLGNASTTTYAFGAVQDRSDIRDKADVRDTELGLEFVNALRPVDFKWDMREDYRPEAPKPVIEPAELKEDASDEEKAKYAEELAAYNAYKVKNDKWLEDVKLANITHDGSKKRSRFHHGLIAQEVKAVLDAKGIDFGGFQDHSIKGGDDVLSIGYEELIAPLIKAVQELSAKVAELEAK
jgi:hypothetical protein